MTDPIEGTLGEHGIGWNMPDELSAPIIPGEAFPSEDDCSTGGLYPPIGFNPGVLSAAQTYMECPVCFDILMAPIYQCPNGHIICNSCISRIDFCGECRIPLGPSKIRNIALEQICSNMETKCPHEHEGCQVVTSVHNLKNHVQLCEFRSAPLCQQYFGWVDCSENITFSGVADHLAQVHHVEQVEHAKFCLELIAPSVVFQAGESNVGVSWDPVIASELDVNVLLRCTMAPGGFVSFTGYLLAPTEDYRMYRMKLQFDSNSKISRLEWTGNLYSPSHQTEKSIAVNTFEVSKENLSQFCKPYASPDDEQSVKLKVKVAFWKVSDDDKPFKKCFQNSEDEKESLEKIAVFSKSHEIFVNPIRTIQHPCPVVNPEVGQFYPDLICGYCNAALFGTIYRCFQCPTMTHFCKHCVDSNFHEMHLMIRISNPDQRPLAEVAYECAASDLQ